MRIILASKSPRRKEILQNLGIDFEIITKETDETSDICEPSRLVKELSFRKGKAVYDELRDDSALIISSDTVVTIDNKILGKPKSAEDAAEMLKTLSSRSHQVVSGVTLIYNGITLTDSETTEVKFSSLSDDVIERYVATNEPMDKAGSYAVQGLASMMIEGINGCYFNVVGFPIHRFSKMLREIGIEPYSIIKGL